MIENRKAFIRIVEAFVAVTIIAGFFAYIYTSRIQQPREMNDVYKNQKAILELIAGNDTLRDSILENNDSELKNFVIDKIAPAFDFEIKICELEEVCSMNLYKKEVYSSETVVSSNLTMYSPKKLKIFMWVKE